MNHLENTFIICWAYGPFKQLHRYPSYVIHSNIHSFFLLLFIPINNCMSWDVCPTLSDFECLPLIRRLHKAAKIGFRYQIMQSCRKDTVTAFSSMHKYLSCDKEALLPFPLLQKIQKNERFYYIFTAVKIK